MLTTPPLLTLFVLIYAKQANLRWLQAANIQPDIVLLATRISNLLTLSMWFIPVANTVSSFTLLLGFLAKLTQPYIALWNHH